MARIIVGSFIGLLIGFSAHNAQACYRNTDCKGTQICLDNVCTDSESSLTTCETDDDCGNHCNDEICHNGVCKVDGVVCASVGGVCAVKNAWHSSCECADFMCSESQGDGDGTVPDMTDAELYDECLSALNTCPDEIPDLDEICDGDDQPICEQVFVKYAALEENCDWEGDGADSSEEGTEEGGDDGDVDDNDVDADTDISEETEGDKKDFKSLSRQLDESVWFVAMCCEEMAEEPQIEEAWVCLLELADDDCEGAEDCFDIDDGEEDEGGTNSGDEQESSDGDDDGQDSNTDTGTNSVEKSNGCQFAPGTSTASSIVNTLFVFITGL